MWDSISDQLKVELGSDFKIKHAWPLAGGDINQVFEVSTSEGSFCIKINEQISYPEMFEKEAHGLRLLMEKSEFSVPKVICIGETENLSYLLMTFIKSSPQKSDYWKVFGEKLAQMHLQTYESFGLDHSNYIGCLQQSNNLKSTWSKFFISERIIPQLKLAKENEKLDDGVLKDFEKLFTRFESLFPNEVASLLHGDLWSGNQMPDSKGSPCIFDPAIYYGHREMDLAMTKLFGGFGSEMYESYHAIYPIENGWENRLELCNLYPLLVHVNLFGGSYVTQVKSIVGKFRN